MKIETIEIKGFRSIQHAKIENCGPINVLVGQNNAGKSNVLTAIGHATNVIFGGSLATLDSPAPRRLDFHGEEDDPQCSVTISAELPEAVLVSVYQTIAADFPQVEAAVPSPEVFSRLELTVTFALVPQPVAYISSIRALPGHSSNSASPLIELSRPAAIELATRLRDSENALRDQPALQRLLGSFDEYWPRLRDGQPLPYWSRDELSEASQAEVRSISARTPNSAEARLLVGDYASQLEKAETRLQLPLAHTIKSYAGSVERVPRYIDVLLDHLSEGKLLHLGDRREPIGQEEARRLLALKMSRGGDAQLSRIQTTVSNLLGVKIDAFASEDQPTPRITRVVRRPVNHAELDVDDFLVQVNGSGIREALRLVLDVEFNQPGLILVEEPEIHLHPALESTVAQHLDSLSQEAQLFVTTHSTNFLSFSGRQNIYLVHKRAGTEIDHLDAEDGELRVASELGIQLSSVFMFDRLVFVEGASDEAVLRQFANTLGINLSQANVGFVLMGSARNIGHYAAEHLVSLLTRRQVECVFILDRDERDEEQIQSLANRLPGATLHVWKQREIENYLLDPEAIAEFVASRTGRRTTPSPQEVEATINEKAAGLKELAVAKRLAGRVCRPTYPDRELFLKDAKAGDLQASALMVLNEAIARLEVIRDSVEGELTSAVSAVDARWATEQLSIAPGHELLTEVLKSYGVGVSKSTEGVQLARLIPAEKISPEVKTLLLKIGT